MVVGEVTPSVDCWHMTFCGDGTPTTMNERIYTAYIWDQWRHVCVCWWVDKKHAAAPAEDGEILDASPPSPPASVFVLHGTWQAQICPWFDVQHVLSFWLIMLQCACCREAPGFVTIKVAILACARGYNARVGVLPSPPGPRWCHQAVPQLAPARRCPPVTPACACACNS